MHRISKQDRLPYSVTQMYDLVSDVSRYPEFIPWCKQVIIKKRDETNLISDITMSLAGVSLFFTGHNTMIPGKSVRMEQVEGPFRFMSGRWLFSGDDTHCALSFEFEFEMRSALLKRAVEPLLAMQVERMVKIFHDRALALYGDGHR